MRRPGWVWWLAFGIVASLAYTPMPRDGKLAGYYYSGVSFLAVVVMLAGILRRRPARPLLWYLLLAGALLASVGDAVYFVLWAYLGDSPFPSVSDVLYLASYPCTAAGLLLVVRFRTGGRDRAGLIDAAIVSTGLALLAWTFIIRPMASGYDGGLLAEVTSLAYPIGDVLLIAVTARLVTTSTRSSPAFLLLVLAQIAWLPADVSYDVTQMTGADFPWLDPLWLVSYVLSATAVWHPSMRTLSEPVETDPGNLSLGRLTLLSGVSLFAPAVLVADGLLHPRTIDWVAAASSSAVMFLLVLTRMRGLIAELRRQAAQLDALAHADGLTGVPNRRSWDEELARAVALARRTGSSLAVGLIDLDHFKLFNDAHGHQAGDLLLKEAAAGWRAALRETDVLARYGGEEFGVIVAGLPPAEALAVVERLRAVTPRGETFSCGLAVFDGGLTPDELVAEADQALYRAKNAGRDRIELVSGPSFGVRPHGQAASTVNGSAARA